jgi:hypothetical protein
MGLPTVAERLSPSNHAGLKSGKVPGIPNLGDEWSRVKEKFRLEGGAHDWRLIAIKPPGTKKSLLKNGRCWQSCPFKTEGLN